MTIKKRITTLKNVPELPEVETIKRQLEKEIVGKKIADIKIKLPKIVKAPLKEFKRAVLGFKIINVRRRAKLIIIGLSSGYSLLIHLKMTGQLIFCSFYYSRRLLCHSRPASVIPAKAGIQYRVNSSGNPECDAENTVIILHTHIIYHFTDGSALFHNDLRRLGYIKLMNTSKVEDALAKEYGPEPLDKNFALGVFKRLLKNKPRQKRKFSLKKISFRPNGRKIKQFLMDQKNIAGIGNIYADEILFYAGVRPVRKIFSLSQSEVKKIHTGIKKILTEAIEYHGSSVDNYLDARGRAGEYHLRLKVYGRANQQCKRCGTPINKIKFFGRGTHFCPKCQK